MQQSNKWTKKLRLSSKWRYMLLLVSLIALIADQGTKFLVRYILKIYETRVVVPHFWNWTLVYNKGAAFSLLDNRGAWARIFFGVVAFVVSIWLIHYILSKAFSRLTGIALSLILGGALGNLVDRIIFGKVTDFIQWYYHGYYWPAFNVADSCIFVGVTILIVEGIFFSKDKHGTTS